MDKILHYDLQPKSNRAISIVVNIYECAAKSHKIRASVSAVLVRRSKNK